MGLSLNKTIKNLLQKALEIKLSEFSSRRADFEEFCGIWNDDDLNNFNSSTESLSIIDPEG